MNTNTTTVEGVEILADLNPRYQKVLTTEALSFLATLQRTFNNLRLNLLADREKTQSMIDRGEFPDFLQETKYIRESEWKVADIPENLQDRRTEITGPVDRKMIINALNSGAKVFMADFEDATSPVWGNIMEGQINLKDAIRDQIDFIGSNGKEYKLNKERAVLKVRPRGWHLTEKHVLIDGEPMAASLFDFGLYFFHNAKELMKQGSGPYFYLPKLENYKEAALWNDVFVKAQELLNIPQGTIKVTVLIETILAAFQMEEILHALRDHIVGLNAGRWDYIFSVIKKFRNNHHFILPDRGQVGMGVPFMKAYAQLLVKTCHKRGAHAIGGMSAFIPSKDEKVNKMAFEKVKVDKAREAEQGYDGTWVAHPFLVPVALGEFDRVMNGKVHQKNIMREDVEVTAKDLLDTCIDGWKITEEGLRQNINVGIMYIESWLSGIGAAALYNLMEDAATAEISRAQVWQWLHTEGVMLADGRGVTIDLYETMLEEEVEKIKKLLGDSRVSSGNLERATKLFDKLVRKDQFVEFLTLEAYTYL